MVKEKSALFLQTQLEVVEIGLLKLDRVTGDFPSLPDFVNKCCNLDLAL